jgi:hypothetical protein
MGGVSGTVMSQIVHVVSILDVPTIVGSDSFQSKEVNGAQNSECRFCSRRRVRVLGSSEWSAHIMIELVLNHLPLLSYFPQPQVVTLHTRYGQDQAWA